MRRIPMNTAGAFISRIEHDWDHTMRLTFNTGTIYDYPNTKLNLAVDLAWCRSKQALGAYFQKHFAKAEFVRVGEGAATPVPLGSSDEVQSAGGRLAKFS